MLAERTSSRPKTLVTVVMKMRMKRSPAQSQPLGTEASDVSTMVTPASQMS